MTDRAKEMIFGILGESVQGAKVLDLFAGSGSLGLEALSRGASWVTFVEKGPWGSKCIHENLRRLNLADKSEVIRTDAFQALGRLQREGQSYELIFLDPPYNKGLVKKILRRIDASAIVTGQTQLVLHHSRQEKLPEALKRCRVLRVKEFGQACLSFLSGGG